MEAFIIILLTITIIVLSLLLLKFRKRTTSMLKEVINKMNYLNFKIDKLESVQEGDENIEEETVSISERLLNVMDNQCRVK